MPCRFRVLVVDDSVVMRRILSEVIASDPSLEVAGCAANGQIALALMGKVAPDVITLDIEMPVMDGLATLRALRAAHYACPVIMLSSLTERGAEATMDALAAGATDYVAKPVHAGDYLTAKGRIRDALLPKIRALRSRCNVAASSAPAKLRPSQPIRAPKVVVIGSSTGGPNALAQVLPALPSAFPLPVLVVQHMPPLFTRSLAQRLDTVCELAVSEGVHGQALVPGQICIAPGDFHMALRPDHNSVRLEIAQGTPENYCRPSVDVLFRSACETFADRVLAIVLTGMGQDGLRGCELLAEAGAQIAVQDEATSVVWGMPGFVARAGLADAILPLPKLGPYIASHAVPAPTGMLKARLTG